MSESELAIQESAEVTAPEAQSTSPSEDATTLKNKLSAADRERVRVQQERDRVMAERDAYAAKIAEYEGQNKSELEKAFDKIKAAEERAAQAEAAAHRIAMSAKYPHATADFDGSALPNEEVLSRLEARLVASQPAPAQATDTPVAPINPRKATPVAPTTDDMRQQIIDGWAQIGPEIARGMNGR
jgi:hypothetical protein